MVSHRSIEQSLYQLAETAWGTRRITASEDFVLQPERLPRAQSPEEMAEVVLRLYAHARKWAPGFEIPFYVPKVIVTPFLDSAGQYRVDPHGYLFIQVSPEFTSRRAAPLAILAHEACHHILDLSGIRGSLNDDAERLTDLAAFICGFGDLVLDGHSHVRKVGSAWTTVHLGYLSSEEYRSAQRWVLNVQHIPQSRPARGTVSLFLGLSAWFKRRLGTNVAQSTAAPEAVAISGFGPTLQRRKVLLARLHGDQVLFDRLLEHERRQRPDADEIDLLDSVVESLEKDRR